MSETTRVDIHPDAPTFLSSISPHITPDNEHHFHLVLGLVLERVQVFPHLAKPSDLYITVWDGESLKALIFVWEGSRINVTLTSQEEDATLEDKAIDDLVNTLSEHIHPLPPPPLTGPAKFGTILVARLARKLGLTVSPWIATRLGYLTRSTFIPASTPSTPHTIRKANPSDNMSSLITLLAQLHATAPQSHPLMSEEAATALISDWISRELLYVLVLDSSDDSETIAAMVLLRRETPHGIGVPAVVTHSSHRRKGYASTLLSEVLRDAFEIRKKEHVVLFWIDGGEAGRVYSRLGFKECGLRMDWGFSKYENEKV